MITKLQGRSMTNEQVLEVLKKSCEKHGEVLIHAQYNPITVSLVALIEEVKAFGYVDADMDAVLIGLYDMDLNPVKDDTLHLENEPCCPSTIVTCNTEIFF